MIDASRTCWFLDRVSRFDPDILDLLKLTCSRNRKLIRRFTIEKPRLDAQSFIECTHSEEHPGGEELANSTQACARSLISPRWSTPSWFSIRQTNAGLILYELWAAQFEGGVHTNSFTNYLLQKSSSFGWIQQSLWMQLKTFRTESKEPKHHHQY